MPANRSATLTASTIVVFQAIPEDATELAPLFLDSSIRLRPEHIYPDVLCRLRLHESWEIQEFFREYVLSLQKLDGNEETKELLELLQDMLYQAVKTQVINEDFFQIYVQGMFPFLGLTFDGPQQEQEEMRTRLQQLEQTIAKLTTFLTDERAFEDYLIAYYSFYSGFTYARTSEWYYQPFVPEAFVLSDTRFWDYVLGKRPHPYEHIHKFTSRSFKDIITSLQEQATENNKLQQRDTPEKLIAEEKARIIAMCDQVLQQVWKALATIHKLKSQHAIYPSIRQFHEIANQACLSGPVEQRGDPLFVQPVGSTRKQGIVDHTTRVNELIIRPLYFAAVTSNEQLLAWLPATSYYEEMRKVRYDIQTAWAQVIRRHIDLRKITDLLADETAILKDYYSEVGKRLGNEYRDVWKEINNENVERNLWEALSKEAHCNAYLSKEMNSVEKLIRFRKTELQKKIAQLTEEHQAYQATVPELEKCIAEEMAAIEKQQTDFRNYVRHIIEILIQDPGSLGEKRIRKESDIKEMLLNLPKREAFVRVGGEIDQKPCKYTMKTADARQAVKQDEAKQRRLRIREQTRSKYCRSRAEVEHDFREGPMNPPRREDEHYDDEPLQSWYEE